jgi:hypothetical protein
MAEKLVMVCGQHAPPNLNTWLLFCDFYFWGIVKQNIYRSNLHTIEELKEIFQMEYSISHEELQHMNLNVLWRFQECVWNNR